MNAAIDPARLYQILQNADLQKKQPALYQLLYNLIGNVVNLKAQINGGSGGGGGGGSTTVINNINNLITGLGEVIENTEYFAPVVASSGNTPVAPTYDSPLTNGDPLTPEIIFDSNGDVVMVTGIPL